MASARMVALLVLAVPAAAQAEARYDLLARTYAAGRFEAAILGFDAWTPQAIRRAAGSAADEMRRTPSRAPLLRAAILAHGDRAWLEWSRRQPDAAELHLDAARLLADALPPEHAAFRARVFLALALRWQETPDWLVSRQLLDQGLKGAPDDVDLLLAKGALEETLATFGTSGLAIPALTSRERARERGDRVRQRSLLDSALQVLRRALSRDPARHEARLRTARVLMHLERPAAARRELDALLAADADPAHRCLAFLTLGRIHEDDGDRKAAREAYSAAVSVLPSAPTPRIARSHLAAASGDFEAARADVLAALEEAGPDPWVEYPMGQRERWRGLYDELRAEIR